MPSTVAEDVHMLVQNESWYNEPLLILVMGASGDLAKNKTFPALFELWGARILPQNTIIHGFARSKLGHDALRSMIRPVLMKNVSAMEEGSNDVNAFLSRCFYSSGVGYGDSDTLSMILQTRDYHNLLVYLAVPPHVFSEATFAVKVALSEQTKHANGLVRIVLEKPFGRDYDSCREMLEELMAQGWDKDQLFRIDHYLGKEMVQNLFTLRSENPWLGHILNNHVVQSVHIVWKEAIDLNARGGFFDDYGIIRDVVQNHLMQLLVLVALDLPASLSSRAIVAAKVALLERIRPITAQDTLLGQYEGYSDDPSILNKKSITPTYAVARCWVDTEAWEGVPFVLEAGKALDEHLCEIRFHLVGNLTNVLAMRVQPNPAVYIDTVVKIPGFSDALTTTRMGFDYANGGAVPSAYARLLLHVLRGRHENFVHAEELLLAWKIFTPVLQQIESDNRQPEIYDKGSDGPPSRTMYLETMGVEKPWVSPRAAL
ncbi:G6pdhp [Mayamaea pseudoterrestris]|nr:G6pdhp [Mayamaea pseudoterrestris]